MTTKLDTLKLRLEQSILKRENLDLEIQRLQNKISNIELHQKSMEIAEKRLLLKPKTESLDSTDQDNPLRKTNQEQ